VIFNEKARETAQNKNRTLQSCQHIELLRQSFSSSDKFHAVLVHPADALRLRERFSAVRFCKLTFSRPHLKLLNLILRLFPVISMLPGSGFATTEMILQSNGKD